MKHVVYRTSYLYTLYNNLMDALIMCLLYNRKLLNQYFFKTLTVRVFITVFLKNEAGIYGVPFVSKLL